jgi:hypothetical protein
MTVEAMRELPRSEKLKLMEALWEALSQPDDAFKSPAWHANELAETERRLTEGQEQVLDWGSVSKVLQKEEGHGSHWGV